MAKFLAIYTGTPQTMQAAMAEGKVDEAAAMASWSDWMERHGARIVDAGGPLGKTKRIGRDGVSDITNAMAAYAIIDADSHEAAAEMFRDHAHFTLFPGEAVEVMPILDIPGM